MSNVKVGDVRAWGDVPDGALVRDDQGDHAVRHARGRNSHGSWVQVDDLKWTEWFGAWLWRIHEDSGEVTVVALGLTGQESAKDLQRLAEVYEVREAIDGSDETKRAIWGPRSSRVSDGTLSTVARILHAAGWRPDMTAEDAARMLAEVRDG
jgi:hypothetical protein